MSDPISPTGSPGQVAAAAQGMVPVRTAGPPADPKKTSSGSPKTAEKEGASQKDAAVVLEIAGAATTQKPKAPPSLEEAVEAFREYLKGLPSNLQFRADSESGYYVFKVVNPVTQEVIRQYPPDEMLEMAKRLKESLAQEGAGILLDQNS